MAGDTPLFCPFCRECFEGEEECPEHELPLVPFEQLPRDPAASRPPREDEELALHELRFGRGIVLAGALVLFVGFLLPFVSGARGEQSVQESAFELAVQAPNLWMVPGVALALVFILFRRRTPAALRGARLAVPLLSVLCGSAIGYTLWRVHRITDLLGEGMILSVEPGAYVMGAGCLLALIGGVRLGVTGNGGTLPHGAQAESGSPPIVMDDEPPPEDARPAQRPRSKKDRR